MLDPSPSLHFQLSNDEADAKAGLSGDCFDRMVCTAGEDLQSKRLAKRLTSIRAEMQTTNPKAECALTHMQSKHTCACMQFK